MKKRTHGYPTLVRPMASHRFCQYLACRPTITTMINVCWSLSASTVGLVDIVVACLVELDWVVFSLALHTDTDVSTKFSTSIFTIILQSIHSSLCEKIKEWFGPQSTVSCGINSRKRLCCTVRKITNIYNGECETKA